MTAGSRFLDIKKVDLVPFQRKSVWGCSSVGRARGSHSRGQGFESPQLHQYLKHASLLDGDSSCLTNGGSRRLIRIVLRSPKRPVQQAFAPGATQLIVVSVRLKQATQVIQPGLA